MKASDVDPVHGASAARLRVKGTLAGKIAAALRRQRRAPLIAARALRAARADGAPPPLAPRTVRTVFCVLCGPGELDALGETIESVRAYGGDAARVLVVEDATADVRWPHIRARHPDTDIVRMRWPTGGPPRLSPPLARGYRAAVAGYDFDVLVKLDTDALLTGPGLPERAAAAFAADPSLGLLGSIGTRADGVPEDYTYDAWVLEHERRWSRTVRDLLARARAGGYDGRKVHGGAYVLSRRALDAMAAAGDLDRRPPWWSQIGEDLWFSLAVCGAGLRIGSWGAPGEPVACASKFLPVGLDEIHERGVLAVHSVRRGRDGESEPQVRAALRQARNTSA